MAKNIVILVSMITTSVFQPFKIAEANHPAFEADFYDHYNGSTIRWNAFQQIFCEFMGPSNYALTSVQPAVKRLQFATIDSDAIPVEMLFCAYTNVSSNSISVWYAQSPGGKFYQMHGTGGGENFENLGIVDQVELPPADVEQSFQDHYARHVQDTTFMFPPNMIDGFCESEKCPGFAVVGKEFRTKDLMLFSQDHKEVHVQMLSCLYEKSSAAVAYQGEIETFMGTQRYPYKTWFVKAPDGDYYEVRLFGDIEHSGLAIRRKARYSN